MKPLTLFALVLMFGGTVQAADLFWQQLTPEERTAAGLAQLTSEQQSALDRLAERYAKEGARRAVEVVRTEAKVEVKVAVESELKKRDEARFGLLETKGEAEVVSSRLRGTFKGWEGRTVFHLENGQTWVQADASDIYWVPPQAGPEIQVRKSGIGGWKLTVLPAGRWVRVKRLN